MARGLKLPEVLTEGECKVLAAVANPRYLTGLRDCCMIRLMLNTGLRASECLNLKVLDIDWNSGQLMVQEGARAKKTAPSGSTPICARVVAKVAGAAPGQ